MRTTSKPAVDRKLLTAATTIRRAVSAFSVRARFERAGELTFNQTGVLGLLFRGGSLTPSEIADRMRRHGFRNILDLGRAELTARYFSDREDGLRMEGNGTRLLSAEV